MTSEDMDTCHNIRDPKSRELIHIPGCMGCAALGHENCTCDSKKPPLLIRRLEKLERRVKKLEAMAKARVKGPVNGWANGPQQPQLVHPVGSAAGPHGRVPAYVPDRRDCDVPGTEA